MKARLCQYGILIAILNFAGCLSAAALRLSVPNDEALEEFRVSTNGDALLLPVGFDGKEYLFVLDTGAESTVYDVSLRERLEKADSKGLSLGKLSLKHLNGDQAMDLERFRKVSGHEIMGVLGMDVLKHFVVQLDIDAGWVRFFRSPGDDLGDALTMKSGPAQSPELVAHVAGAGDETFILDTGMVSFGSGALSAELFDSLVSRGKLNPMKMSLDLSVAGTSPQLNGRVESLSIGQNSHRKLVFARQTTNLLGLNFLSRYVVTFDFPQGTVYLKKGKRFNDLDEQDRSGLHIVRSGKTTSVETIDAESPAALAGVRAGDEILRIEDRDASEQTLFAIRKMFCCPAKQVRLSVRRDNQETVCPIIISK
jgi:hypothetical protein